MKKIAILYFSGVGATRKVAQLIRAQLQKRCKTSLFSLENTAGLNLNDYDALVIGTPTYHAAPAHIVAKYFNCICPLKKQTPAYIYNTRGLYSYNTNRILAKQLKEKNIITIIDRSYKSPASDGSLFIPQIKMFFEFEKRLYAKIILDCAKFAQLLNKPTCTGYMPRFKLSSILNAPNKFAGQLITFKIYLHKNRCVKCGVCTKNCPHKAIVKDTLGYPVFVKANCKNCYRCIHHCPKKALSLIKRRKVEKVIKYR